MKYLLVPLQFTLILFSTICLLIAVLLILPFSRKIIHHPVRKMWTKAVIAATGAKFNIYGQNNLPQNLANTMILANHISWLDTIVLLRITFLRFIGKIEMLKWPGLSSIIKAGDTIFIDRKNKRSIPEVNGQLANLLHNGATIGLYPEGTTGHGRTIMPFKPAFLEAPLMANSFLVPVVISYRKENDKLATEVTFNKVGWITTVINTLKITNLVINVTILPPVASSSFNTREELSNHLFEQMNACYTAQQTR